MYNNHTIRNELNLSIFDVRDSVQGHHLAFIETAERVKNHKYTHNWRQRS